MLVGAKMVTGRFGLGSWSPKPLSASALDRKNRSGCEANTPETRSYKSLSSDSSQGRCHILLLVCQHVLARCLTPHCHCGCHTMSVMRPIQECCGNGNCRYQVMVP